ncbi:tetratricopeptide repeat-containing hybrid sensor histidine kinase/response regulator [Flavobacterium silvaticum]|uniref:histidine kinase n=1 Tax=Flavobacterium silvaticum TaxID=1852020 RepID=A0A972FVC5_9FLAO|nr:ATP-binding protein [Flavobacterium silvaticum]NMH29378.1 response regulator [Flavobacterium silvaticum]
MNRLLLALLCFLYCLSGSAQNNANKPVDSTAYFIELAQFNSKINNYANSLFYTQKAIDFAHRNKDAKAEAEASLSLGILYIEVEKYNDATEMLTRSIALFNTLKPSSQQAYAYYNLGLCYMEKENYTEAENTFDKAKTIYQSLQIPDAIDLLNLQKGIVYRAKGKNKEAVELFSRLISTPDKEDDIKIKPEALYQLGTIESENRRSTLALNYLNQSLSQNLQHASNLELRARIFKALSVAYEDIGDLKKSHDYLKKHIELYTANQVRNKQKLGAEDYAKFKEGERLKTIEQLDKENREKEKANKFAKLITILAIALISILSLLSLSLYKNNIIRNQSNTILKDKNKELQIAKDKAEKASKARAEFLSTVSHELRTPLNAINGITHLLLEENPKKSQLNYLTSLQFSGNYLLTFINEILEINRIESNNVVAENINFNLKLLLENIQNSLKEHATKNNNKYTIEIDPSIPDILVGDPTKLSQIFMNLINNALKFTQNGEVRVIVSQLALENSTSIIRFEVLDTGIGIPEDKQETIFDSFAQGSIEINRKYGGTGLGLNIVKKLVDILGGNIELESRIGQGSSFFFTLHFKVSSGQPIMQDEDYDESVFTNKKVLLIEDNKINQMITAKMCENKLMLVEIIDNGEDAIEAVKNNYYDLVLMDVHLPGINGTIATQTIRTFDQHTRIIALTAISLNENREMLLSYGMNDVITKPFDPNDFYRVIAQNLSN